jgi:hypothetical protein
MMKYSFNPGSFVVRKVALSVILKTITNDCPRRRSLRGIAGLIAVVAVALNCMPALTQEVPQAVLDVKGMSSALDETLSEMQEKRGLRTWTSSTGKQAKGRFHSINLEKGQVTLENTSGEQADISFHNLSKEDLVFLDSILVVDAAAVEGLAKELRLMKEKQAFDAATADKENRKIQEELARAKSELLMLAKKAEAEQKTFAERERQLKSLVPSNDIAENAGNAVTLKRLEVFKDRYVGKTVQILNCTVSDVGKGWQQYAPDVVQRSSNGLVTKFTKGNTQWATVNLRDGTGTSLHLCFADSSKWGEFLLALDDDAKINVEAFVYDVGSNDWHAIHMYSMEKVPQQE